MEQNVAGMVEERPRLTDHAHRQIEKRKVDLDEVYLTLEHPEYIVTGEDLVMNYYRTCRHPVHGQRTIRVTLDPYTDTVITVALM